VLLFLRSLFFTIVVPGTVTMLLPYLILEDTGEGSVRWGWRAALALLPIALGAAVLLRSIWEFFRRGRGTLAPIDPPKELVVTGLYRYVRNPMYVGVLLVLLGETALFASRALLLYTALWFAVVHLFVVLYEEPTLAHRFGDSYTRYRHAVRRWVPGRRYTPP
jgi:protein-S-isoprenylcysteine O-methyltransferase Ste14